VPGSSSWRRKRVVESPDAAQARAVSGQEIGWRRAEGAGSRAARAGAPPARRKGRVAGGGGTWDARIRHREPKPEGPAQSPGVT